MEENKTNQEPQVNNEGQEATNNGQSPAPANQQEKENDQVMVGVPAWAVKIGRGFKKAAKVAVPVVTALLGAFIGVKVGSGKERTRSKAEADSLNRTIDQLRSQLDSAPLELPNDIVSEVPGSFSEVVDSISE